jgi:signal transduction histidine kinase
MKMKWTNRTLIELFAIVAMAAVVLVLAILQYRWTGEISRTEQERWQSSLSAGVGDFNQEFSYDFERLSEAFLVDPGLAPAALDARVLHLYENWIKTAANPKLLAGVYLWRIDAAHGPTFESLNADKERFEPASWSPDLASIPRWASVQSTDESWIGDREAVYYPWTFMEDAPALVRPIFQFSSDKPNADPQVKSVGYLIVQLNRDYLQRQYLPDLIDRHFGDAGQMSFNVAVRDAQMPYQWVYESDPSMLYSSKSPDASIDLLSIVSAEARRRGRPQVQPSGVARQWELVVQHPGGSLEATVTAWRRRSLAISFTLLAVMAMSVGLIFSVARRAEHLAKLQMEFVTGVSHELCTPLAVINSAAENLADGVVDKPAQIQEYGSLIRDQSRRLERMVDEVLLFAADRSGRSQYDVRPVEISALLAQRLDDSEVVLREAGFTVEKEISPDLPMVAADAAAFGKCFDNLLSNAMKYSVANRWIAIRARVAQTTGHPEVQITVQDKGVGIPAADLPHVFEPFYRVQSARDAQTRGVGLGLYLVKRMMQSMGGRVTVTSEPGLGSFFTLHFPVAGSIEHHHAETV